MAKQFPKERVVLQGKRVLLTANYSVIEPLFALHLGGILREEGIPWTFFPVKKYDFAPLFKRVEQFGATHVGFNVYSGNHKQMYAAADELRKRGVKVIIGGPHATYFAQACTEHADVVCKGQSFESFRAIMRDDIEGFVRETVKNNIWKTQFKTIYDEYKREHGLLPNAKLEGDDLKMVERTTEARVREIMGGDESVKLRIANILASRILFRDSLSDTFPKPDRATFYSDNPDMRDNPIKNAICGEGCPFACTYCYNRAWNEPEMYGKFNRRVLRKVADVVEELAELKDFNTKLVYFQDDVFFFEPWWGKEFMPQYKAKVGLPFHAQLRLELANFDIGKERLSLMKSGGCTGVTVAIENGMYDIRARVGQEPLRG